MKRFNWLLIGLMVLCLATVPLAGCVGVSQSEYEALQAEYEALQAEYEALMEANTSSEVEPEAVEEDWLLKRKFQWHTKNIATGDTWDCNIVFLPPQPIRIRGWKVVVCLSTIWQGTQLGYVGGCCEVTRGTTCFTDAALDRCFTHWSTVGNLAQNEVAGACGSGFTRMNELYDRQTCDDLGLLLDLGESIAVHSNIHNCIGVPASATVSVIWFYEEV